MMKKLLAAMAMGVCLGANAATAFFTGNMRQAQSATYQMGWECQYSYAGRTFWVFMTGSCASSVEVQ